jgi:hypothetical protein
MEESCVSCKCCQERRCGAITVSDCWASCHLLAPLPCCISTKSWCALRHEGRRFSPFFVFLSSVVNVRRGSATLDWLINIIITLCVGNGARHTQQAQAYAACIGRRMQSNTF